MTDEIDPKWAPSLREAKPGQLLHWRAGFGSFYEVGEVVSVGRTLITVKFPRGEFKFRLSDGTDNAYTHRTPGAPSVVYTEASRLAHERHLKDLSVLNRCGLRYSQAYRHIVEISHDDVHAIAELLCERYPEVRP